MKSDAGRSLEVFEFKEEDEVSDIVPAKFAKRLKRMVDDDAVLKYDYLGFVSNQVSLVDKASGDLEFLDVDSADSDQGDDDEGTCPTTMKLREIDDVIDIPPGPEQCNSAVFESKRISPDRDSESLSQEQDTTTSGGVETCDGNYQLSHDMSKGVLCTEDENFDAIVSDSEDGMFNNSHANLISDIDVNGVYFDGCMSNPCSGNQGIPNKEITMYPDIVILHDSHIWDAEIRFTSSSLQLIDLNSRGGSEAQYECSIDNIVSIEAQWHERVQMVVVLVHVLRDPSASDQSGIQEVKFTLFKTDWSIQQENIISLNNKYKPLFIWSDGQSRSNQTVNERLYYPEFNETFDELVFPKDDSDPVTVCKRDIDLLQPEVFINDTIIDFYIKYLKDRLVPEKTHRFHFFNSFFFRKLADLERSQFDAPEGRSSFLRVRKWTRKVNLFEKDYIVIPVNSNLHWSLIVICHPGEIAKFDDNNVNSKHKVPCILHMDSIKGSHTGLKSNIQSYLWEEWKEKQNEATDEISLNFFNLRFISLEVPQQENSYDCGLFLLHYVELFLEEAPENFNPFHITKYSNFLNVNWFPPGDVSLKRAHIQRIIYHVNMNTFVAQQRNNFLSNTQMIQDPNKTNEAQVELLSVKSIPADSSSKDLLCEPSGKTEQSTLRSSETDHFYGDELNLDLEFIKHPSATGVPDADIQGFCHESSNSELKSFIATIEEIAGNGEHILTSLPNASEPMVQSDEVSFQLDDYRMRNMWSAVNLTQTRVESTEFFECTGSLNRESGDFMHVEVEKNALMKDAAAPSQANGESHHLVFSSLAENNVVVSEATSCPSPVVLESARIEMSNCCQQINAGDLTDNPKDATPYNEETQKENIQGENNSDLDELCHPKRARVEVQDEVKFLTRSIAKDLLS